MRYKTRVRHIKTRATNPGDRNYKHPEYVKFRKAVKARDNYECQMCKSKQKLKVHHIKRWVDAPGLRFAISNGITLCRTCHDKISENEDSYRPMFTRIVFNKTYINSPLSRGDAATRGEPDA